jgi:hypothetical protein
LQNIKGKNTMVAASNRGAQPHLFDRDEKMKYQRSSSKGTNQERTSTTKNKFQGLQTANSSNDYHFLPTRHIRHGGIGALIISSWATARVHAKTT